MVAEATNPSVAASQAFALQTPVGGSSARRRQRVEGTGNGVSPMAARPRIHEIAPEPMQADRQYTSPEVTHLLNKITAQMTADQAWYQHVGGTLDNHAELLNQHPATVGTLRKDTIESMQATRDVVEQLGVHHSEHTNAIQKMSTVTEANHESLDLNLREQVKLAVTELHAKVDGIVAATTAATAAGGGGGPGASIAIEMRVNRIYHKMTLLEQAVAGTKQRMEIGLGETRAAYEEEAQKPGPVSEGCRRTFRTLGEKAARAGAAARPDGSFPTAAAGPASGTFGAEFGASFGAVAGQGNAGGGAAPQWPPGMPNSWSGQQQQQQQSAQQRVCWRPTTTPGHNNNNSTRQYPCVSASSAWDRTGDDAAARSRRSFRCVRPAGCSGSVLRHRVAEWRP